VALIQFPTDRDDLRSGVVIRSVQIEDGKIKITGTADDSSQSATWSSLNRQDAPVR
jgi:hypothetical protein